MKRRQHEHCGKFWLALLQQYRETIDEGRKSAAQKTSCGIASSTDMAGSEVATVPIYTATVASVVWSTMIVTVHVDTTTPSATTLTLDQGSTESSPKASLASSRTTRSSSDLPASDQPTTSPWRDVPPMVTAKLEHTLPAIVKPTGNQVTSPLPAQNATESIMNGDEDISLSHKRAVIGGLSGTIAGLVLIGVIIFLVLRRRRIRRDTEADFGNASLTEKGVRPELAKKWTSFVSAMPTGGGSPRHTQHRPSSMTPAVDEEHRIIRISTQHWPRPFAPGEGEGYRDSVAPGRLRVMNPDISRPTTPRLPDDTSKRASLAGSLTGFLMGIPWTQLSSRNGLHSQQQQQPFTHNVPTITVVDPSLSRECIAPYAAGPPSFRCYPSPRSLQTIRQGPLEDPFLTRPDEANNTLEDTSSSRPPTRSGLRSAAGEAASKTLSHLGSLLHPFRSQTVENLSPTTTRREESLLYHRSLDTTLSSPLSGRPRSDPFDLDRASMRWSSDLISQKGTNGNLRIHEGT